MTTNIMIGGKEFPMSFSVGAQKAIIKEFGGLENLMNLLMDQNDEKSTDAMIKSVAILTAQGCAYKNYFEKDLPVPNNAPVVDGKWVAPTEEEIEVGMMFGKEVMLDIAACIGGGSRQEIEAKMKNEGKNQEATQG